MGMQRHAGGGNAIRLLYALPGVTGDWRYPGGGASYSTSGRFVADTGRCSATTCSSVRCVR